MVERTPADSYQVDPTAYTETTASATHTRGLQCDNSSWASVFPKSGAISAHQLGYQLDMLGEAPPAAPGMPPGLAPILAAGFMQGASQRPGSSVTLYDPALRAMLGYSQMTQGSQ